MLVDMTIQILTKFKKVVPRVNRSKIMSCHKQISNSIEIQNKFWTKILVSCTGTRRWQTLEKTKKNTNFVILADKYLQLPTYFTAMYIFGQL